MTTQNNTNEPVAYHVRDEHGTRIEVLGSAEYGTVVVGDDHSEPWLFTAHGAHQLAVRLLLAAEQALGGGQR